MTLRQPSGVTSPTSPVWKKPSLSADKFQEFVGIDTSCICPLMSTISGCVEEAVPVCRQCQEHVGMCGGCICPSMPTISGCVEESVLVCRQSPNSDNI